MFKDLTVLIRQLPLPEFLLSEFGLVTQRTDDTLGNVRARRHFHHADIVHIAPQGLVAVEVEIPTIEKLVATHLARYDPTKTADHLFTFVRMKVCLPFIECYAFVWKDMTIELINELVADNKAHHITVTDLDSLLHHLTRKVDIRQAFAHTPCHQAVLDEHGQK